MIAPAKLALVWIATWAPMTLVFDIRDNIGNLKAPGLLTLVFLCLSAFAVLLRGLLINSWGNEGRVAAGALGPVCFLCMLLLAPVARFPDVAFGLYVFVFPIWVSCLFLFLGLWRVVSSNGR